MARFYRLMVLLAGLLLSWFEPIPCRAQPPDLPLATSPPAPSPTASPATPAPPGDAPGPTMRPPWQTSASPQAVPSVLDARALSPKTPSPEATDLPLPINLATALRLADARPLLVAAAQASAWVAEAQLDRAKVLWVPVLDMSFIYYRHDGNGPDFNRGITTPFNINSTRLPINQNLNWAYAGGGLNAVGPLTDAIFTPLAARQVLNSRRWDIQTAKNDALLQTAEAYFNVHRYRGTYAGALDTVQRGRQLVARIEELAKDLVPRVEVDRAKRMLADLQQQAASAREMWRVSSADLTQVLRLDPRAVVVPLEHDHLQLTLIDPARSLDDLIPLGLTNRPELASQQALVQAVLVRIRQEKLRPLIPSILITGFQTPAGMATQFGYFGTGNGGKLNLWSLRDDISAQVVWQLEGFGFGNLARIKEQRGAQSRTTVELFRIQDRVAAEVTQAQANLQSAAVRVVEADRTLRHAILNFNGNYEGLRQTRRFDNVLVQVYRPQEAVVSLERLKRSYDEYFGTVADYNVAQFRLFHALGYPAAEISDLRPPGDIVPVDTARPSYLPTVGTGPPPATR